jgi:hypothetical protein
MPLISILVTNKHQIESWLCCFVKLHWWCSHIFLQLNQVRGFFSWNEALNTICCFWNCVFLLIFVWRPYCYDSDNKMLRVLKNIIWWHQNLVYSTRETWTQQLDADSTSIRFACSSQATNFGQVLVCPKIHYRWECARNRINDCLQLY